MSGQWHTLFSLLINSLNLFHEKSRIVSLVWHEFLF